MKVLKVILGALLLLRADLAFALPPTMAPPTTPASLAPWPMSLPALGSGVIPTRHLQAFRRALDAGSAVVVFMGDSTSTSNANNQIAPSENLYGLLSNKILVENQGAIQAGAKITFYDRGVGGRTWADLAGAIGSTATTTGASTQSGGQTTVPVTVPSAVQTSPAAWYAYATGMGGTTSAAVQIQSATSSSITVNGSYAVASGATLTFQPSTIPSWYTAPGQPWITSYVTALAPDLIVIPMGVNDAQGIAGDKIKTVISTLQNSTNFPKKPDVIIVSNAGYAAAGDGAAHQLGVLQAASYDRSIAQAGGAGLGTTGAAIDFGLIDLGRVDSITRLGFDPVVQYNVQSLSNVTGITSFPYTFPTTSGDFDIQMQFVSGSTNMFTGTNSYTLTLGSVIASGSQNATLTFGTNGSLISSNFLPAGAGSSTSLTNATIGTGDVFLNVTVKQSRLTVTAKTFVTSSYVTTTIYDGLMPIVGGTAAPKFSIATGSGAPNMTIVSYSGGVRVGRQQALTDSQAWGNDASYTGTGGNGVNHVGSYGAAMMIRNALEMTRMSAHDGALMPLIQSGLTAIGTGQANGLVISGDINVVTSCPAGTALVLPKQVVNERRIVVINKDASNACPVFPNSGAAIGVNSANASVSISANGGEAAFSPSSTTQWWQN